MQDIHSLTGGGGGGGAPPIQHLFAVAAGDRRLLRPPNQALKCPRCDSLNTKFCYYNNYNLSQPRHFCKSCRRYWTKGGVLRNVPVGGGCRKSKRSSSSTSPSSSKSTSSKPPPSPSLSAAKSQPRDECSLIASAPSPDDIPTLFHEYDASTMEKAASSLYGIEDIGMDEHDVGGGGGMMTEVEKYPSMNGSRVEMGPLSYGGMMSELDGFGVLDWEGESNGGDRGDELFEVTGAVDDAYWSQQIQWTAADDDVVVVDRRHHHHHHQQQQQEAPGGLFLP